MEEILDNTLITGGDGSVASYIDFGIKLDHQGLDITDFEKCKSVIEKHKPKVILHLAAETDLTKCQNDPAHAYLVNSVGTYNLAMASKIVGAKMVYISTDAVFPNSKNPHTVEDQPNPESVYGQSKYLGELAVKGILDDYIIARTSWVFGGGKERDKKFVAKFIAQLDKPEAQAVNDQFSSPTYARDLTNALKDLIVRDEKGTFHIVNSGTASRYDMALVISETLEKKTIIKPVTAEAFKVPMYLQSSGGLVSDLDLPSWQDSLKEYLNTEWH